MEYVFLTPLKSLYSGRTPAYRALNSMKQDDLPARSFVIATFSVLVNGIEALGSFMTGKPSSNRGNFLAFIKTYMHEWDRNVPSGDLPELLWKHFRNGIAHGFCIQGGGIDNEADRTRWKESHGHLHIGPNAFFEDFRMKVEQFFDDVQNSQERRQRFLRRFQQVYPN